MSDLPIWVSAAGTITVSATALFLSRKDRWRSVKLEEKAHASRISVWPVWAEGAEEGSTVKFRIRNNSDEPINEVVLFWVFIQGAGPGCGEQWIELQNDPAWGGGPLAVFGAILPGQVEYTFPSMDVGIVNACIGAEISFIDRNGSSWVRRADGELEKLDCKPIDHYQIARPLDYKTPVVIA